MLEFVLAVALVVLPLISGILEFAQLATARHILAFATQEAARSEAIAAMDERSNIVRLDALVASFFDAAGTRSVDDSLRLSFARGLLPLFGGDFASGVEPVKGLEQWQLALAERDIEPEPAARTEEDGAIDDRRELADVSRPRIRLQRRDLVRRRNDAG